MRTEDDKIVLTLDEYEKARRSEYQYGYRIGHQDAISDLDCIEFDFNRVGQMLYEERIKQGKTASYLASLSYISPQAICAIEHGRNVPSLDSFVGLLKGLGYKILLMKDDSDIME